MIMITIDHMNFELIENYRDAFDEEQFVGKYSEVLNKYDYIVGDIGYEKLRLTGFHRDNKRKVERDKKFSAIQDYLSEYCNFGCPYFVLRKVTKEELKERELAKEEGAGDDGEEALPPESEAPGGADGGEKDEDRTKDKTYAALKKKG